ncbi:MAG: hypothetical protein Aurels2KO_13000 [Aureliella sp.]
MRRWIILGCLCLFGCEQTKELPPQEPAVVVDESSDIRILAWNIESDGSNTDKIISQLTSEMPAFDILALSEVPPADVQRLSQFFGERLGVVDRSIGDDRLILAWSDRFDKSVPISIGGNDFAPGYHRAPLGVVLSDSQTGLEFVVMNNHLARGNAELRQQQAALLVDWARNQSQAVIAVGDYNMDYDFAREAGNDSFAEMLRDGIYKWIKPKEMIDTNWYDPEGDGVDNYPGSMLDFTFVAGPAMDWSVTSEVIVRPGDFPDDDTTSDHRPIYTTIAAP